MPFINDTIADAMQKAQFPCDGSFAGDPACQRLTEERAATLASLKKDLEPDKYAKVLKLIGLVSAIRDIDVRHYFQEGWLACERHRYDRLRDLHF